jgi:APA family basic amino acid/polyamine antiporter
MGGLSNAFEVGSATATVLGGDALTWTVTLLIALALFGSLNGTILAGARIASAMARDGALIRSLGVLHPTTRTPARALWLQAALACLLVLTGTFEQLVELTSIAMLLMGGLSVVALFLFRRRRPGVVRPYRATGYPVLPAFYLSVSIAVVGISIVRVVTNADDLGGLSRWLPLLGLVVFVAAWAVHRVAIGDAPAES